MKVTVILIVIDALGMIPKGLVKGVEELEIGGRAETTRTTASLRSARIMGMVLETKRDLLSLRLQWKTISLNWCEKISKNCIIFNHHTIYLIQYIHTHIYNTIYNAIQYILYNTQTHTHRWYAIKNNESKSYNTNSLYQFSIPLWECQMKIQPQQSQLLGQCKRA